MDLATHRKKCSCARAAKITQIQQTKTRCFRFLFFLHERACAQKCWKKRILKWFLGPNQKNGLGARPLQISICLGVLWGLRAELSLFWPSIQKVSSTCFMCLRESGVCRIGPLNGEIFFSHDRGDLFPSAQKAPTSKCRSLVPWQNILCSHTIEPSCASKLN